MRLQHLHLLRPVPYPVASRIQDAVVRQHIDFGLAFQRSTKPSPFDSPGSYYKPDLAYNSPTDGSALPSSRNYPPQPFLLTFQTIPTYTCGRREIAGIGPDRIAYLRAGGRAEFYTALRGGQTTWHGPGQLTAYLVLSLRAHGLTPRCYVRFLETAVIDLCARLGIPATTTADPGVWLAEPMREDGASASLAGHDDQRTASGGLDTARAADKVCELTDQLQGRRQRWTHVRATDSKLCAVGVHMRRGVTSHGLGLNIRPDLAWFRRIVACGLEGKRVTSIEEAYSNSSIRTKHEHLSDAENPQRLRLGVRHTALLLAELVARGLHGVTDIDAVDLVGSIEPSQDFTPPLEEDI